MQAIAKAIFPPTRGNFVTRPDIALENPRSREVFAMLAASDRYYAELYPEESNHLFDVAALEAANVAFYVARMQGKVCGFGAVVDLPSYAEIKRMFVKPDVRGKGIGKALLATIEQHAIDRRWSTLRLETGVKQTEAIRLYAANGFVVTPPFGSYRADPLSVFMQKDLR